MPPVLVPLDADGREREKGTAMRRDGIHATPLTCGLRRRLTPTPRPRPSFRLQGPRTWPSRIRVPAQTSRKSPRKPRPNEGARSPTSLGSRVTRRVRFLRLVRVVTPSPTGERPLPERLRCELPKPPLTGRKPATGPVVAQASIPSRVGVHEPFPTDGLTGVELVTSHTRGTKEEITGQTKNGSHTTKPMVRPSATTE